MSRLILPSFLRDQILAAAIEAFPSEACGLLAGYQQNSDMVVDEVVVSNNLAADPQTAFEVDPSLRIQLAKQVRGTERTIVGHFHSHPTGSTNPSPRDLAAAYEPGLVWLIVGMREGKPNDEAAWRLQDGRAKPVALVSDFP